MEQAKTSPEQGFVHSTLTIVDELESKPEIGVRGATASMMYAMGGCSDVRLADMARASFEESINRDLQGLEQLNNLLCPDAEAQSIRDLLARGICAVDKGNQEFASNFAAHDAMPNWQDRIRRVSDLRPMAHFVEGMTLILESLTKLADYTCRRGLTDDSRTEEWRVKIEREKLDVERKLAVFNTYCLADAP